MKNVFFALAFMLVGTFAFANSNVETSATLEKEKVENFAEKSCTVNVKFGESNVTITNTCDCTQTEACDGAYKIARLAAVLSDKLE